VKTIIFALIPLILSIGVVPAISFAENIDSPRKQMANGITAENVVCKSDFTLMIRSSGNAACVTPATAEKLESVGWGTITEQIIEETTIEASIEEEITIEESIEESGVAEEEGKEISVELSESIGLKGN
jgi:hypothetical protein